MFRKLFLVLLAIFLATGVCFAATATVTQTEYGYEVTGGTDATLIAQDTWVTSTAYTLGQNVVKSGIIYTCLKAHTSGTFATDLAAGDWKAGPYAAIWVMAIGQKAYASTDISTLTSGAGDVSAVAILNTDTKLLGGVQLVNPKVTLGNAADIVYIYINRQNF